MAPGLNGRQTGTVPRTKARNNGSQSHRSIRDAILNSTAAEWEPVLEQNNRQRSHRKFSSAHSEAEADLIRYDLAGSLTPAMGSQMRLEDNINEGSTHDSLVNRMRVHVPDKKQVLNKITQIQDYIQQTASLMNALKGSDCPEKQKQYEKLSAILDDLKDSERKLLDMVKTLESSEVNKECMAEPEADKIENSNSDIADEDLVRRAEEGKKKLELLQRRKQELLELQEKAMKQLQEAQMEQTRLVARASSLNQDLSSNAFLDLNVQQLSQRLKTTQQLFKTSNQINDTLMTENRESNLDEAEHPDEDQIEMSDTETDFQIVSDKVAELNMMKAQLSQIQKLMSNISTDSSVKDDLSTPTETMDDRRDQAVQRSRHESGDDSCNNAAKLEQAKMKLNHLTQLLEFAQGSKVIPSSFVQITSGLNDEGASAGRTPSPSMSGKSQLRPGEEAYVETMQHMTRELEERTAAMKEEHEKLVQARQELENLARKIPLVKAERASLSPNDSGSEIPCLTNIDSNGRFATPEHQSPYNERSPYPCRPLHARSRQRGVCSAFVPTVHPGGSEKKCKNEEMSRSVHSSQNGLSRDQGGWSPSPTVSFCDNGSCSVAQNQNQLDKSTRMVNDMLQRAARPDDITIEELYVQHQMLTRTVSQCSHLLWLQQKQIIELRNALMYQQSAMCQNMFTQPSYPNQPQRNTPIPPHLLQLNPTPNMPFPNQMPVQPQEQNFLSPNQSIKLNSGSIPSIQSNQDFSEQFYQHGAHTNLPFSMPDMLDYQFRYGNYNRSYAQHINSNTNTNHNLNQNGNSGLNNRIPVPGMSCLGPEDSGALNNQVPPGNRANNYWDNFRSYSRQNLLSHSKSNEDTETARRTSTTSNQERPLRESTSSIVIQNNTPAAPSAEPVTPSSAYGAVDVSDYEVLQSPPAQTSVTSRPSQTQVCRSRSVESQSHRKNGSRNQENDSRNLNSKNEAGVRSRIPDTNSESLRSVRNDVGQTGRNSDNVNSSRNFVQLVRDLDNDEGRSGINKIRVDKRRSRNEERGNLNNRSNSGLPVALRDNLYSEVTNFITANESRPQFLIQLFRDLQQITTDPLRQRTLESIHETVNVNNFNDRSHINGSNINIIDNRNNIRESRSNLNRKQGDDQNIDNIVCQIRENRQNIVASSAGGGNNLENPNISNIRNLGNSRNNLECEGLRDLRTYYEANLCNFGHNSTLENPNLSNIRENLTRGTAATDLDNANPKNLYLSMYDNARKRNQEVISGQEATPQNSRPLEQAGNELSHAGSSRGNKSQCSCSDQSVRYFLRGGPLGESSHHPGCPLLERDIKYVNVTPDCAGKEDDSEADCYNHCRKSTSMTEQGNPAKKSDDGEGLRAVAFMPEVWGGEETENASYATSADSSRTEALEYTCSRHSFCNCRPVREPQLDNGDLAEADQSRTNEEAVVVEECSGFINSQVLEAEDENWSTSSAEAEDANLSCLPSQRVDAEKINSASVTDTDKANSCRSLSGQRSDAENSQPNFSQNSRPDADKSNSSTTVAKEDEDVSNYVPPTQWRVVPAPEAGEIDLNMLRGAEPGESCFTYESEG